MNNNDYLRFSNYNDCQQNCLDTIDFHPIHVGQTASTASISKTGLTDDNVVIDTNESEV